MEKIPRLFGVHVGVLSPGFDDAFLAVRHDPPRLFLGDWRSPPASLLGTALDSYAPDVVRDLWLDSMVLVVDNAASPKSGPRLCHGVFGPRPFSTSILCDQLYGHGYPLYLQSNDIDAKIVHVGVQFGTYVRMYCNKRFLFCGLGV